MHVRHSSILAAVAGLAMVTGLSFAQEKKEDHNHNHGQPVVTTPATPAVNTGSKVEFNQLTHEFGVISDEKEVETKFKFTNTGTGELEILNLQGSCGCTVPALAKKKYAPGESGEIAVKYNPHNRRGKQNTNVTVTTNVADKPQVVLGLQSEVKPTVMTEPQVATLGQIEKGKEGKATLTITSRKLDLVVTQVTPNDAKVNAKIGEKKEVEIEGEKAVQFPIEITLAAEAPVGQIQTQCVVRTSDPQRTLNFMVLGEVVGQVKVEPQRITLGGLSPGQDINTSFRVTSRTGSPMNISGVDEAPAVVPVANKPEGMPGTKMFEVKVVQDTSANPPAWVVTLTGKAPADGSTFRGDIVLKTDMPGEAEVKVPYYGFIRQKPRPVPTTTPAGQPSPSLLVPD